MWIRSCLLILTSVTLIRAFSFNTPDIAFVSYTPNWLETAVQRVKFQFRTTKASVLLFSHRVLSGASTLADYGFFVFLKNGELHVLHLFKNYEDSITTGRALNQDEWHTVTLFKDPQRAKLFVQLDERLLSRTLAGYRQGEALRFLQAESSHSQVIFGNNRGPIPADINVERFVGCIDDIFFSAGNGPFTELEPSEKVGVLDDCVNLCRISDPCQNRGRCVNRYVDKVCDCLGTGYQGPYCSQADILTITLRGYEWLTYEIYSKYDKSHSPNTRLSMEFKTSFADSVLFYGSGSSPQQCHLAVSLENGTVVVSLEFGEGEMRTYVGRALDDDKWHNLTISHVERRVLVQVDQYVSVVRVKGDLYRLLLHPTVYIGGINQKLDSIVGLRRRESFVGCVRNIYYNHNNILDELAAASPDVHYQGSEVKYGCETVEEETTASPLATTSPSPVVTVSVAIATENTSESKHNKRREPVTTPSLDSSLVILRPDNVAMSFVSNQSSLSLPVEIRHFIDVKLQFRTLSPEGLLVYVELKSLNFYQGYLEIVMSLGKIKMTFSPVAKSARQNTIIGFNQKYNDGLWHSLVFNYDSGDITMSIDKNEKLVASKMPNPEITVNNVFNIGSRPLYTKAGFIGCMKNVFVQEVSFDARKLVNTDLATGVELDNCNLTDLCRQRNPCRHGSLCVALWKTTRCDCTGTGYTGDNCHFPMYKRSCDELYAAGETRTGVFPVDLDGTGPLNFTYVWCDMGVERDGYKYGFTTVMHNLKSGTPVRGTKLLDLKKIVEYRNFGDDELEALSKLSMECEQKVEYSCVNAPLLPGVNTWLTSVSRTTFSGFGSSESGQCGCADNATCIDNRLKCNCDLDLPSLEKDGGVYTGRVHIPVKELYFLQQGHGAANVSLGDFRCWGRADELDDAVTFGLGGQPVGIPGWTGGDRLEFWFRTFQTRATLLHQVSADGTEFSVSLTSENTVVFNFSTNLRAYSLTLTSSRLNSGTWQHVTLEYDSAQARISLNLVSDWLQLSRDERMASYEGTMFIGGQSPGFSQDGEDVTAMLGCIGSMFYNDQKIDLPSYIKYSVGVKKGCRPGCSPNPCGHGSSCTEAWTSYKCTCRDTKLIFGQDCQININNDAVTFYERDAYMFFTDDFRKRYLRRDITLSFRTYQSRALLFYFYDTQNNFIQVHIEDSTKLVLTMNQGARVISRTIPVYPALNNGEWRQLFLIQKRDRIKVRLDGKESVVGVHRLRLGPYTSQPFKDPETVRPPRLRPPVTARINLLLGGTPYNFTSALPSFHGCIRGMKVGKSIFKLGENVNENGKGVLKDCIGGCDFSPCKNGAICTEYWNANYSCNCTWTTYRGQKCTDEVGGGLDGSTIILYNLHRELELTDQYDGEESFSLGFSTNSLLFEDHVIVFINEVGTGLTKYVTLILKQGKRLILYLYFGRGVYEIQQSGDFDDGHRHKVIYRRYGKSVTFQVDSAVVKKDMEVGPFAFAPYMFMLGGVVSGRQSYRGLLLNMLKNFTGCISNVEFYKNNEVIQPARPFDVAFGLTGSRSDVTTHGRLVSATCAPFYISPQIRPLPTEPPPQNTGYFYPPWNVGPADTILLGDARTGAELDSMAASAATIAIAACLIVSMIILSVCIAFALWRFHEKKKWLEEQKELAEEKRSLKGPRKPDRYIYRGTDSLPPRLHPPSHNPSQYSLYPNKYGSAGGLPQYSTLPFPPGSRRISPAVSRGSTLDRSAMDLGSRSNMGASTRSHLYVPGHSVGGSTNSMLSERSRLASVEDLTADEMESPQPVRRRKPRPAGAVFDDDFVGDIPPDPFAPLMAAEEQEKARRRRTPSSISEVIAEMERLTKSLPTRNESTANDSRNQDSLESPAWPPEGFQEWGPSSEGSPGWLQSRDGSTPDWAAQSPDRDTQIRKEIETPDMDESWSPQLALPTPDEGPILKTNPRNRPSNRHRHRHGNHRSNNQESNRGGNESGIHTDETGSSPSSSSGIGHTDNGDDADDGFHILESEL